MKLKANKIFYTGILLFILYEFLDNYFLMPYWNSQRLNSITLSHTLHYYKIYVEAILLFIILFTAYRVYKAGKIVLPTLAILLGISAYYFFSCFFTAENRYRQPQNLVIQPLSLNRVAKNIPVIGVEINGESKAYPVPIIRYHHQVVDSIGGKVVLITYCGICRTGRVYEPLVSNRFTRFRLAGTNHSNAVLEDETTRSWWSQETGICLAGKLKGARLPEVSCNNMILEKWAELYPTTQVMQPDPVYKRKYRMFTNDYLVNADNPEKPVKSGTWAPRTFIIGLKEGVHATAVEWNYLVKNRIVMDTIGETTFCLALSKDAKSYAAFAVPAGATGMLQDDTLFINNIPYNFAGVNLFDAKPELKKINAHREFWFSWQYAHPNTKRVNYPNE
jgi:hypothetical protein